MNITLRLIDLALCTFSLLSPETLPAVSLSAPFACRQAFYVFLLHLGPREQRTAFQAKVAAGSNNERRRRHDHQELAILCDMVGGISSARAHRQESPDREVQRGSPAIVDANLVWQGFA